MEVKDELIGYMIVIQDFDKDSAQDGQVLHQYLIHLTNIMARANYLMAEYQKQFRDEKKKAYLQLSFSQAANQKYYAPSLANDYIDSVCGDSGYLFDLSERLSRLCVHTSSAIITIISSLKSERQFANY